MDFRKHKAKQYLALLFGIVMAIGVVVMLLLREPESEAEYARSAQVQTTEAPVEDETSVIHIEQHRIQQADPIPKSEDDVVPPPAPETKQESPVGIESGDIDSMQHMREEALSGPHGSLPIEDVLQAFKETPGGPAIQELLLVLAVRKEEALPHVKEALRNGDWFEKHQLTKLLRYSPWPEVYDELIALAQMEEEENLGRTGALYALGALGNPDAGPVVTELLNDPDTEADVKLVAISTLARIGYWQAADVVRHFANSDDLQMGIFANHALARFGQPVDRDYLFSALEHDNYVIRQQVCEVLAFVEGEDVAATLRHYAENDHNRPVRQAAFMSLIQREIANLSNSAKLNYLHDALEKADARMGIRILSLIHEECGEAGREYLEEATQREDRLGERAAYFLLMGYPNE